VTCKIKVISFKLFIQLKEEGFNLSWEWLSTLATQWGFFGVFLTSFLGALSIIVPIPYTVIIFTLGMKGWNPLLLAVSGGLGSAFGELSGYALGYYGGKIISEERRRKMEFFVKMFGRYGPVLVFIFALTPLPDDLLFIPLGLLRYKLLNMFIPCLLGKALMCYILAAFGNITKDFLLPLIGEENMMTTTVITAILLTIIFVILLKVDWEKLFEKYVANKVSGG